MDGTLGGLLGLIGTVLASTGLVFYKLGRLTSTVEGQGKDIQEIKQVLQDGNPKPKRRRAKK